MSLIKVNSACCLAVYNTKILIITSHSAGIYESLGGFVRVRANMCDSEQICTAIHESCKNCI